jgi:dienelactone hydrolase
MHLVRAGMAALIYDKRGLGESGGTPAQAAKWSLEGIARCGDTFNKLAGDADAAVALLAVRPDIDGRRIGLVGISQAGWIMPLAARNFTAGSSRFAGAGRRMALGAGVTLHPWSQKADRGGKQPSSRRNGNGVQGCNKRLGRAGWG